MAQQPKTFREALANFLTTIAGRPPVVMAALTGIVTALTGNVDVLEPYKELIGIGVGSFFGYLASRLVAGPETAKTMAKTIIGVEKARMKNTAPYTIPLKAVRAAERVLKIPPEGKSVRWMHDGTP